jgi:4-hydroxy-2-oxoheptanedioate aldolase
VFYISRGTPDADEHAQAKAAGWQARLRRHITFPAPPVVEMLGYMGFDWVLIDNEHGSITVDTSEEMIRAAELTGIAPIVRPVANRPEVIAPFLDRGAWGVQVPHVNTREEAEAAVAACKYYPEG